MLMIFALFLCLYNYNQVPYLPLNDSTHIQTIAKVSVPLYNMNVYFFIIHTYKRARLLPLKEFVYIILNK